MLRWVLIVLGVLGTVAVAALSGACIVPGRGQELGGPCANNSDCLSEFCGSTGKCETGLGVGGGSGGGGAGGGTGGGTGGGAGGGSSGGGSGGGGNCIEPDVLPGFSGFAFDGADDGCLSANTLGSSVTLSEDIFTFSGGATASPILRVPVGTAGQAVLYVPVPASAATGPFTFATCRPAPQATTFTKAAGRAPVASTVTPNAITAGATPALAVTGTNLSAVTSASFSLGTTTNIAGVSAATATSISVQVPSGLTAGSYQLVLKNAAGASCPVAFTAN